MLGTAKEGSPLTGCAVKQADPVAGGEPQVTLAVPDYIMDLVIGQRTVVAR